MKTVITAKAHSSARPLSKSPPLPLPGPARPSGSDGLCRRCLGPGHSRKECTNLVRCLLCYNYGHISQSCLSKIHAKRRYRVVSCSEAGGSLGNDLFPNTSPPLVPSAPLFPLCLLQSLKTPLRPPWRIGHAIQYRTCLQDSPSKNRPFAMAFAMRSSSQVATRSSSKTWRSSSYSLQ